jgi:hypothetical protein
VHLTGEKRGAPNYLVQDRLLQQHHHSLIVGEIPFFLSHMRFEVDIYLRPCLCQDIPDCIH